MMFVWMEVMQMWYVIKCVQIGSSNAISNACTYLGWCAMMAWKMQQRNGNDTENFIASSALYMCYPCCLHHQTRHTFKMQDRGFVLTLYVPGEQMKNYVHQWNLSLVLQRDESMELNRDIYPYIPWVSWFVGKRETLRWHSMWNVECILWVQHSLLLQIRLLYTPHYVLNFTLPCKFSSLLIRYNFSWEFLIFLSLTCTLISRICNLTYCKVKTCALRPAFGEILLISNDHTIKHSTINADLIGKEINISTTAKTCIVPPRSKSYSKS